MFGLTRREQRWKAEQAAIEAFVPVLVALASAKPDPDAAKPLKPNLGCLTTTELLEELRKRGEKTRLDCVATEGCKVGLETRVGPNTQIQRAP